MLDSSLLRPYHDQQRYLCVYEIYRGHAPSDPQIGIYLVYPGQQLILAGQERERGSLILIPGRGTCSFYLALSGYVYHDGRNLFCLGVQCM